MPCLKSLDGRLVVCGSFRRRKYYYFSSDWKAVLYTDSLWYEPNLVLKREKGERLDRFRARVRKKLRFIPQSFQNYKRKVSRPMLNAEIRAMESDKRRRKKESGSAKETEKLGR